MMKHYADKGRSDREFNVGDLVFLKLQPYRQKTIVNRTCLKLSAKYFGPFKVLARIGKVAYKLDLPTEAKVHPVFHVSLLKLHVGNAPVQTQLPLMDSDGAIMKEPVVILDRRMNQRRGKMVTEVLIQWSNSFPEDATWEIFQDMQAKFPDFHP